MTRCFACHLRAFVEGMMQPAVKTQHTHETKVQSPLTGWGTWGEVFPALPAVCWGLLAGTVLQTFQPDLWSLIFYRCGFFLALTTLIGVALGLRCVRGKNALGWLLDSATQNNRLGVRWWLWFVAWICSAVMAFSLAGWRAAAFQAQALSPQLEGIDLRVTGVVVAMPQVTASGIRFRLALEAAERVPVANSGGTPPTLTDVLLPPLVDVAWYRSDLYARSVAQNSVSAMANFRVHAFSDLALPAIHAGDRWTFTVRLKAPHGLINPHGFDYELWMWEQGVQATGYVRAGLKDIPPQLLGRTWRYPIEQWRQHVRDAIFERLAESQAQNNLANNVWDALMANTASTHLQSGTENEAVSTVDQPQSAQRVAGVVAALVTGDQRAIERADWDIFRATGVAHLMSISGLHITLFAWVAGILVRAIWRKSTRCCLFMPASTAGLWVGVVLATMYAVFSGWGIPAQRTVLMLAVLAVVRLSGQRWPWPMVWLLAAAVVVTWDPWAVWQAGFWLSFVAVGVLFATNFEANRSINKSGKGYFLALIREQWVVTLALTPLGLMLFGQVSLISFVANLLAIPWVTLVVTPLALAGMLIPPLWQGAAWALQPLIALLQWLAAWPGVVLWLPVAPIWLGGLAVVGGVVLAMRWSWRWRIWGIALVLPVLLWQPARPPYGQFDLLAADIGQGNAVLLRTANHSLLYDTGPQFGVEADAGDRVLNPLLRAMGERLDMVVLSHRDSDHTGGAAAVLSQQTQATVLGSLEPSHPLRQLRSVQPCVAGQRWVWDGVVFTVLHPQPPQVQALAQQQIGSELKPTNTQAVQSAALHGTKISPNSMSCVLRVQADHSQNILPQGARHDASNSTVTIAAPANADIPVHHRGAAALLVGDIEAPQERYLLEHHLQAVRADWLLVPHHGSKTSSTTAFLAAVKPTVAVAQAGYRNRFGHPAPAVQQRYIDQGVYLVSTPFCGASHWSSSQPSTVRCQRQIAPRYWRHMAGAFPGHGLN